MANIYQVNKEVQLREDGNAMVDSVRSTAENVMLSSGNIGLMAVAGASKVGKIGYDAIQKGIDKNGGHATAIQSIGQAVTDPISFFSKAAQNGTFNEGKAMDKKRDKPIFESIDDTAYTAGAGAGSRRGEGAENTITSTTTNFTNPDVNLAASTMDAAGSIAGAYLESGGAEGIKKTLKDKAAEKLGSILDEDKMSEYLKKKPQDLDGMNPIFNQFA